MRYHQHETDGEVTLVPAAPAVATMILLHGLGADGNDFVPVVRELGLPDSLPVRFVFPNAPVRPVTVNGGHRMRAWYDIKSFTPEGRADSSGIAEATGRVARYVARERAFGIESYRIVLAGFSQGGAIALHAGLRHPARLAGILALSTYLPFAERLAAEKSPANAGVPIFMAHGSQDPVVHLAMGTESRAELERNGYAVEWHEYPMQHEVSAREIADVARWVTDRLAP